MTRSRQSLPRRAPRPALGRDHGEHRGRDGRRTRRLRWRQRGARPDVVSSCKNLTVTLQWYEGSAPNNHVTVTIDGVDHEFDFGDSWSKTFDVVAEAGPAGGAWRSTRNRSEGEPDEWDSAQDGMQLACKEVPPTTEAPTTTVEESTTRWRSRPRRWRSRPRRWKDPEAPTTTVEEPTTTTRRRPRRRMRQRRRPTRRPPTHRRRPTSRPSPSRSSRWQRRRRPPHSLHGQLRPGDGRTGQRDGSRRVDRRTLAGDRLELHPPGAAVALAALGAGTALVVVARRRRIPEA